MDWTKRERTNRCDEGSREVHPCYYGNVVVPGQWVRRGIVHRGTSLSQLRLASTQSRKPTPLPFSCPRSDSRVEEGKGGAQV